jgi:hypothetical protein
MKYGFIIRSFVTLRKKKERARKAGNIVMIVVGYTRGEKLTPLHSMRKRYPSAVCAQITTPPVTSVIIQQELTRYILSLRRQKCIIKYGRVLYDKSAVSTIRYVVRVILHGVLIVAISVDTKGQKISSR